MFVKKNSYSHVLQYGLRIYNSNTKTCLRVSNQDMKFVHDMICIIDRIYRKFMNLYVYKYHELSSIGIMCKL